MSKETNRRYLRGRYLEKFVARPGVCVRHVDVGRLVDLVGDDGVDEAGGRQLLLAGGALLGRGWRRPRHVGLRTLLFWWLGRHGRQLPHVLHALWKRSRRVIVGTPTVVVLPANRNFHLTFSST